MWEAAKKAVTASAGQITPGAVVTGDVKAEPGQDVEMVELKPVSAKHAEAQEGGSCKKKAIYSEPLALMHRLLSDIAARLLVDGLVSVRSSAFFQSIS